jgi:hypothetical protein
MFPFFKNYKYLLVHVFSKVIYQLWMPHSKVTIWKIVYIKSCYGNKNDFVWVQNSFDKKVNFRMNFIWSILGQFDYIYTHFPKLETPEQWFLLYSHWRCLSSVHMCRSNSGVSQVISNKFTHILKLYIQILTR